MDFTPQQQQIIDHDGNSVVLAMPGSGKTTVVAEKVRRYVRGLQEHQGVAAISYTNKASKELQNRSSRNGFNTKSSFFGTIDKFAISQIVIPFGRQVFGTPKSEMTVLKFGSLPAEHSDGLDRFSDDFDEPEELSHSEVEKLADLYCNGIVLLESVGVLSTFLFERSAACRNYLKAKFKYLFIDEYQDIGWAQHRLFLDIVSLGITGVAVGDVNQSIFAFSGKSSKYLAALVDSADFRAFPLTINHRCHLSIINYSNRLLDPAAPLLESPENRVFLCRVSGNEAAFAGWVDRAIARLRKSFDIETNKEIAVLTRGNRTAQILNAELKTPHKLSGSTVLDESFGIWSQIFVMILFYSFDRHSDLISIVDDFGSWDRMALKSKEFIRSCRETLKTAFASSPPDIDEAAELCIKLAEIVAPRSFSKEAINQLYKVLTDQQSLASYMPANPDEINVMTIHKSKGLEFDAIIHADLHEWILPSKGPGAGNDWDNPIFFDWYQDLNLHYVGVTRARKASILLINDSRTKDDGRVVGGADSEFLHQPGLSDLRKE